MVNETFMRTLVLFSLESRRFVQWRNEEWYQLRDFHDGTLLYYQNLAIANFGHGMLQNEEKQVLHIGGSTDLSKFLRSTSDNWKW